PDAATACAKEFDARPVRECGAKPVPFAINPHVRLACEIQSILARGVIRNPIARPLGHCDIRCAGVCRRAIVRREKVKHAVMQGYCAIYDRTSLDPESLSRLIHEIESVA